MSATLEARAHILGHRYFGRIGVMFSRGISPPDGTYEYGLHGSQGRTYTLSIWRNPKS